MKTKIKFLPLLTLIGSSWFLFSSLQTHTTSNQYEISGKRIGAICNDGWRSYSTGSGTCSHHGGVDYWLYAPSYTITDYEESDINVFGAFISIIGVSGSLYFMFKYEDR